MEEREIPLAPDSFGQNLYRMWMGAYGDHRVYVKADSFDDAFEYMVDFFDRPDTIGLFTFTDESDYRAAARDLGIAWADGQSWSDLSEEDQEKIREATEVDLSTIGHTTLLHMPQGSWGAYVASWEWGGDEIEEGSPEWRKALRVIDCPEGWRTMGMGGGCTAWQISLPGNREALISADDRAPEYDGDLVIGLYHADPDGSNDQIDYHEGDLASCLAWLQENKERT